MQTFEVANIGTRLTLSVRTEKDISEITSEISSFLNVFENKFSRFLENNWLFGVNKTGSGILDQNASKMLEYMRKIAYETDGYFDPTIGKRLSELWYHNKNINFYHPSFVHADFDTIIKITDNIITLNNGIEIEFGGIGKEFCIDWIFDFLIKNLDKNTEFLINFWGDMASVGSWNIALESPFVNGEAIGTINLKNRFLACSAPTKRKWQNHHHLINPFTKESSTEMAGVFLTMTNAIPFAGMLTDGFATALSVMNFQKACEILDQKFLGEGLMLGADGKIHLSQKHFFTLFYAK